jgi:hypothetical protein
VFGHVDIDPSNPLPLFFKSTAKRANQLLIEDRIKQLRSPSWPRNLAPIDAKKAAAGKILYGKHCGGCHEVVARDDDNRHVIVNMTPLDLVGTDPVMINNATMLESNSGPLKGARMPPLLFVPPIPETEKSFELVGQIVVGAILAPPDWAPPTNLAQAQANLINAITTLRSTNGNLPGDINALLSMNLAQQTKNYLDKKAANVALGSYKARPLDGIWATAPYLHNGSVPNLFQLLLPAAQRASTFFVGSREFDAVNVGFRSDQTPDGFLFDTSLPGNRNSGHEGPVYGTDKLSDDERWQLVEYLKTL